MRRKKRKDEEVGRGRLLDAWIAPEGAGGPLGCFATTFTFEAAFFEEQCLGRFLCLETDPEESGAAYLLEREEKLRQVWAGVLVDRQYAADERALSWDVLSVRVPSGCMHAKVSLLAWANAVRVLVASANLTEAGYRSNLEVYGTLDFADGQGDPKALLEEVLVFLRALVALSPEEEARSRSEAFLATIAAKASTWAEPKRRPNEPEVRLALGGEFNGRRHSVLAALRSEAWRDSGPPRHASIVSPFFDDDPRPVAEALRGALAQRGERSINFHLATFKEKSGSLHVQAPPLLKTAFEGSPIYPLVLEHESEVRQLHAKCLWLENDRHVAYMLGSSNCTAAGLGVGDRRPNIEANLVYLAPAGDIGEALARCFPNHSEEPLDLDQVVFSPAFDDGAAPGEAGDRLPAAFLACAFDGAALLVRVEPDALPAAFVLRRPDDEVPLASRETWEASGRPERIRIPWEHPRPPAMLEVLFTGQEGVERKAFLLVNVTDRRALPLPEELRALSLETLLDILTMARPIHEAVSRALARNKAKAEKESMSAELDPHRRVRTESFLLQRTKRFAHALEKMKRVLEAPVYSLESLRWRVHGPVGPVSLARAVEEAASSGGEVCFLLSEVALLLRRAQPEKSPGTLPPEVVRAQFHEVVCNLKLAVDARLPQVPPDLSLYVSRAFSEALS